MDKAGLGAGLQGFVQGAMDAMKMYMMYQQMQNEKENKEKLFQLSKDKFEHDKQVAEYDTKIKQAQYEAQRKEAEKKEQLETILSRLGERFPIGMPEEEANTPGYLKKLQSEDTNNLGAELAAGSAVKQKTYTYQEAVNDLISRGLLEEAKELKELMAKPKDNYKLNHIGNFTDNNGNHIIVVSVFNENTGEYEFRTFNAGKELQKQNINGKGSSGSDKSKEKDFQDIKKRIYDTQRHLVELRTKQLLGEMDEVELAKAKQEISREQAAYIKYGSNIDPQKTWNEFERVYINGKYYKKVNNKAYQYDPITDKFLSNVGVDINTLLNNKGTNNERNYFRDLLKNNKGR